MTLVEKLVRCYSPSGSEKKAVRLLERELKDRGFKAYLDDAGNIVGKIGHGSKQVYLIGHIDTVKGNIPVRLENGKLYGRGSVDAKGSLAVFVEAASTFLNSEQLILTVIGCVDEERNSAGAVQILNTFETPDVVLIGEPSGWDAVTLGYKGSMWVNYHLEKPTHHYGLPEPSVVEEAISFFQALESSYPDRGTGFKDITFRLSDMNTTSSDFLDFVQMNINIRIPPRFDIEALKTILKTHQGDANVSYDGYVPPVVTDKHNELVRAFLKGIRSQGAIPRFKFKTGTSDMNLFNSWNKPMVAYGPGDSSLDHTPDEFLNLEEYQHSILVLCSVLKKLEGK